VHTFDMAAFVEERRAVRERDARLERLRRTPAPAPMPPPRAVAPAAAGAVHCTGSSTACGQPSAA